MEPSRIGSGRTIEGGAAQPHRLDGGRERPGRRAREGRRGRPGPTPRAWSAAATAWASSRKRPQGTTSSWPPTTKVSVPAPGRPAASSIRSARVARGASGVRPATYAAGYDLPVAIGLRRAVAAAVCVVQTPASSSRRSATPSSSAAGDDPVGGGDHLRPGVAHGHAHARPREHRQVVPRVADGDHLAAAMPSRSPTSASPDAFDTPSGSSSTHSPIPAYGTATPSSTSWSRAAARSAPARPASSADQLDDTPTHERRQVFDLEVADVGRVGEARLVGHDARSRRRRR